MCSITPASYPKTSRISGEFRGPLVEVGKFPSPPHFSWKPSDETEGGGRKRNALCVRVCVIHVSCLGLTASLPCVKSFSSRGLIFSWSVFFIDPCLFCTGTFPLSALWKFVLDLSASVLLKRFGGSFSSVVFLGFVGGLCFAFCRLAPSPQSCMDSVVCFAESRLVVTFTDVQRCGRDCT